LALVSYRNGINLLSCKWVYRIEYNSVGSIERQKARLGVRGFNQLVRLDYTETFSPIVKSKTVRIVLTLVVSSAWVICQLNVKNTFFRGDFHEDVCMTQPQGFAHPDFPPMSTS